MIEDVVEGAELEREVGGGDGASGKVGSQLAAGVDTADVADGVDLAEEERDEPEPGHSPAGLGDEERGVRKEGGGKLACGDVRPEDEFGVAGDPPLDAGWA